MNPLGGGSLTNPYGTRDAALPPRAVGLLRRSVRPGRFIGTLIKVVQDVNRSLQLRRAFRRQLQVIQQRRRPGCAIPYHRSHPSQPRLCSAAIETQDIVEDEAADELHIATIGPSWLIQDPLTAR